MQTNSQLPVDQQIEINTIEAQTIVKMMHTAKSIDAECVVILNQHDKYVSVCLSDNAANCGVVVSAVDEDGDLVEVKRFANIAEFAAYFEV